jgi:large subunit ribosomal protein L35
MKTRKSIKKRFKVTKQGKVLRVAIGQGHNKSKRSGKEKRSIRKWVKVDGPLAKKIKELI